ncbi:hypothetical protein ACIQYQ_22110, partial [Pseudomonas asiatica]|uniref:hypothetical protein n=1 Tax=Pseudomonas asiatica TaxID=2219225 RepID=UPI00383A09D4
APLQDLPSMISRELSPLGRRKSRYKERPCVASGLRSSPGNISSEAENLGPLRSPFATQGGSYKGAYSSLHAGMVKE